MSRLDEIKARADAATKGPWLQDGPWWTDDGGSEPTALPCVVDASRALVVFPPDATDVGMKRPEDRAANMAFIAAAREDVPWLVSEVERLERWKFEACEVMSGLRELGRALGLGLGVQITGPDALAEVARLTEEYDAILTRQSDLLTRTVNALRGNPPPLTSWSHHDIPELAAEKVAEVARLTAERDALAAQVTRVESLAGQWERLADTAINPNSREWLQACAATLRECLAGWQKMHAALAGSEADTSDTQPADQEDQS